VSDLDRKSAVTAGGALHYARPLSDDDLLRYFHECYRESQRWFDPIKEEDQKLADMYAGSTLSEPDLAYLASTARPPVSFNFALRTINVIDGMNGPKDATFTGQGTGEENEARGDWLTDVVRQEMDRCKAHTTDSDTLRAMLIGGYGFTEHYLDTSRVPIHIVRKSIPFHEAWPDPDAQERNLRDMKFFIHEREWLLEEVEAMFPDQADELQLALSPGGQIPSAQPIGAGGDARGTVTSRSRIFIYRFLYWRTMPMVYYVDPETGDEVDSTYEDFRDRHEELKGQPGEPTGEYDPQTGQPVLGPAPFPQGISPQDTHPYKGKRWYQAYIATGTQSAVPASGKGLILRHEELSVPLFPIACCTGFKWPHKDEKRVRFFGIARAIHEPQLYINRSALTYTEILERGAKGGGMFESDGIFGTPESFASKMAEPGLWMAVKPGALGGGQGGGSSKFADRPVQTIPTGFDEFMKFCIGVMGQISLITDPVAGSSDGDNTSQVALSNLQEHSMRGLQTLFHNYNLFMEDEGRIAGALAVRHLPATEIDRMLGVKLETGEGIPPVPGLTVQPAPADPQSGQAPTGPDGKPQMVPITVPDRTKPPGPDGQPAQRPVRPSDILKQWDATEFDVAVDTTSASPTQRLAALQLMTVTDMEGTMEKAGFGDIVLPELMRLVPIPGGTNETMADAMQAMIDKKNAGPSDQDILNWMQSSGPDQVQQMVDKAGLKLPERTKPPSISVALKGALQPDSAEGAAILQAAGIPPTPGQPGQLAPPPPGGQGAHQGAPGPPQPPPGQPG
jgi:hypothetical protein